MRISPQSSFQSMPMCTRLCQFLNALANGQPNANLLDLAATLWTGTPSLTIWESESFRPRSALLDYPEALLFFINGVDNATQAWALTVGYRSALSNLFREYDDNTYLAGRLLDWWIAEVKPRFNVQRNNRIVCGHSLGGAFCSDVVWHIIHDGFPVPNYVTFGAPKSFGRTAAAAMDQMPSGLRFFLPTDPVPLIWNAELDLLASSAMFTPFVAWQHPQRDGMQLDTLQLTPAVVPSGVSTISTLDLGSWLSNYEDNPNHSLAFYLARMQALSAADEAQLQANQPAPLDEPLVVRQRQRPEPEPAVIMPIPPAAIPGLQKQRRAFVAATSPPSNVIKLFTWRRIRRKYGVFCNGHLIAWGFRRHSAASAARDGNDMIFRLLSQGLALDPDALMASLQEWWNDVEEIGGELYPLMRVLRTPVATRPS